MSIRDLEKLADAVLVESLPPALLDVIDECILGGMPRRAIMAHIRRIAKGEGPLTVLACEAYLEKSRQVPPKGK